MGIKVVTIATTEPVTLAEAKLHLRLDTSDEDSLITAQIKRAREECEHLLGRSIATRTMGLYLDDFPDGAILLPRGPVVSIDWLRYVDTAGALQTISSANYTIDDAQVEPWLLPAYGYEWPQSREQANAVNVQYVAGFASCPEVIRGWILMRIGSLYRFREADAERVPMPLPFVDRMLDEYRVMPL